MASNDSTTIMNPVKGEHFMDEEIVDAMATMKGFSRNFFLKGDLS
jgi:hypothetical protein